MNILIEGGNLNPDLKEGTRNIAITHAEKLAERGHNVVILTRRKNNITGKVFPKFEIVDGLKYYRWSNYIELFFGYKKILKKEKIDIVHVFAKGVRPTIYSKLLKGNSRIALLFTLTGYPITPGESTKKIQALKSFDLVIIPSKTIYEKLKIYGINNSINLAYGIDTKNFSPSKDQMETKITNIACVSGIYKPLLIALKQVSRERKIKIFFSKKMKEQYKNYIDNNFNNSEYINYVDNLAGLFKNSHIAINLHTPGIYLTCASPPALILEAMSCGAKIISTKVPEIKEFLEDNKNSFLVKEHSVGEIYQTIIKSITSKKDLSKEARKIILEKYDIDNLILEYEKIYSKFINQKNFR